MTRISWSVAAFAYIVSSCIVFGFLGGCGGASESEVPNSGKSVELAPGSPGFDIECIPVLEADTTAIDVYYGFPATSLMFVKLETGFRAICDFSIRVLDLEGGNLLNESVWSETTHVATYARTQHADPFERVRRVHATPGNRRVEVVLDDTHNNATSRRAQVVAVPDPRADRPSLGKIVIQWLEPGGGIVPFVFFHVPSGLDSLAAVLSVFHIPPDGQAHVHMTLERLRADTTVPRLPYAYSAGITFQRQISLDDSGVFDSVSAWAGVVSTAGSRTDVIMPIPALGPGLYRIGARVTIPGGSWEGGDLVMAEHRVVSVKGVTFPRPSTLNELVDALAYIATDEEMHHIREAKDAREKRDRFDEFWLARTGNTTTAAALLRDYYTRVNDANRFFSGVSEGWKTDRGMVYIVLGPPESVGKSIETQVWGYSSPGSATMNAFQFSKMTVVGGGVSLVDYILIRNSAYEQAWTRVVSRWRHGESL